MQAWLKAQTTAEVLKVLNGLQHPPDCAPARKLVCALDKGCGFGCQMHHVVHCLRHAVALNKTMVLKVRKVVLATELLYSVIMALQAANISMQAALAYITQ